LKPTYGKVIIKGEETTNKRVQELSRSVGYVFQNPNHQLFAKTVTAELEFGPRNLGLSEEEVHERVEKAIEFFNLDTYRNQHPYRISFPLRKLVGMASIYTMRPDVFILTNPPPGRITSPPVLSINSSAGCATRFYCVLCSPRYDPACRGCGAFDRLARLGLDC
jgi:energy-coupling factor transport system ATP-binding protein